MLYVKPHLYALTEGGTMTCFQADNGDVVWRNRMSGRYSASPIWADGNIYCLSESGKTTVIKDGPTYEVLAENDLTEGIYKASIAVSHGQLFIRSEDILYAIDKKAKDSS
jgi:outer membrane protein assembly factor BamB